MVDLGRQIMEFSSYHRSTKNRFCHYIGLPIIVVAVLGCLARAEWVMSVAGRQVEIDAAQCLLMLTLIIDIKLNWRIAIGVFLAGVASYVIGNMLPLLVLFALFLTGWGFQVIGHRVFENNNPAFMKNLVHLFIGPRWLVNRVIRAIPENQ